MSFTRAQGYPQKSIKDGAYEYADKVYSAYNGTAFDFGSYEIGMPYELDDRCRLSSISATLDESGTIQYLELRYSPQDASPPPVDSEQEIYTCATSTTQEPIETHPSYKYNWNHSLSRDATTQPDLDVTSYNPFDDGTAYEKWQLEGDNAKGFAWVHWRDQAPSGYEIPAAYVCKKQGVDSWLAPNTTITATAYYSSAEKAGEVCADVGTPQTPAETFGFPSSVTINGSPLPTFLLVGADVQMSGKKWAVSKTYQYSPTGFDAEIYTA